MPDYQSPPTLQILVKLCIPTAPLPYTHSHFVTFFFTEWYNCFNDFFLNLFSSYLIEYQYIKGNRCNNVLLNDFSYNSSTRKVRYSNCYL